jgi:hypothetical protein
MIMVTVTIGHSHGVLYEGNQPKCLCVQRAAVVHQHVERLRQENEVGFECRHDTDSRVREDGEHGPCSNCGFYMYLYGYVCSCGRVFCFTCHHHRIITV